MSILMGPFDRGGSRGGKAERRNRNEGEEELLVFGYASKLYRNDTKALLEDSGQLLIPWMGDNSLMVDRYDIRNRLDDKSQFGLKPSLPHRPSKEEDAFEDMLDHERYLSLHEEEEYREEEDKKRLFENLDGSYSAVGFSYSSHPPSDGGTSILVSQPTGPQHPPTSSIDIVQQEEEEFTPPAALAVPAGMKMPVTAKLHSIIEKTAFFISKQGPQMEIMIKTKQKFNPFFSFLDRGDALYPYYQHLIQVLSSGTYSPRASSPKEEDQADIAASTKSEQLPLPNGIRERSLGEGEGDETTTEKDESGTEATAASGGGAVDSVSGEDSKNTSASSEDKDCDAASTESGRVKEEGSPEGSNSDDDEEEEEEEGYELHPLLRGVLTPRSSKASTPSRDQDTVAAQTADASSDPLGEKKDQLDIPASSSAFYAKRLSINSAPSLVNSSSYPSEPGQRTSADSQYMHRQHHHQYSGQYYQYGSYSPAPTGQYYDQTYSYYTQNLQAYYEAMSAEHINKSGPTPPPPDLQPVVDKTAFYVAKNDAGFESTVIKKHCDDPKFSFLNPWDQYHTYYQAKKAEYQEKIAQEEAEKENALQSMPNLQRLSSNGSVSFKLQMKPPSHIAPNVDLSTGEEEEEKSGEVEKEEERAWENEGRVVEDSEPPAKRQCLEEEEEEDVIGDRVEEFLSKVKEVLGTD